MERFECTDKGMELASDGDWLHYADAQAQIEALQAQLQTARYDAVRAFVRGEDKLCLACGAKEPCELKDDPSSPCTFDPTPMELKQQVEALQRERDFFETAANTANRMRVDTERALDAERQRARTATQLVVETIGATGPEDLESALGRLVAQLNAEREKVVAVAKERDVQCTLKQNCIGMLEQEREKVKGLERELASYKAGADGEYGDRIRRTLDATTPAPDTSIIGKCTPPVQWNQNAQVRGDVG